MFMWSNEPFRWPPLRFYPEQIPAFPSGGSDGVCAQLHRRSRSLQETREILIWSDLICKIKTCGFIHLMQISRSFLFVLLFVVFRNVWCRYYCISRYRLYSGWCWMVWWWYASQDKAEYVLLHNLNQCLVVCLQLSNHISTCCVNIKLSSRYGCFKCLALEQIFIAWLLWTKEFIKIHHIFWGFEKTNQIRWRMLHLSNCLFTRLCNINSTKTDILPL